MPIPADSHTTMNEGIHISAAPNDSADILALYRKMAERSPLPIAMTVGQTHLLCGANPAFSQLFGSQGVALLEQPLIDAVPAVDADCVLALLDQVYQTGEAILGFDQQPFHAQNNQISWSYSVWPIPDQQGRPIGLVIQIHDTTANHRDEQAAMDSRAINEQLLIAGLRESELAEQLQLQLAFTNAITNSLGEGLYVLDTAGRCTFVNPAAERMLGWTGTELQGRDISVVIPADAARGASSAAIPAPLQDILRFGTTQRSDNAMFVHRDGGVFPTAYSAAPIIMDKQIVGAVVAFRDMAEMRRLQRLREEYLALISHDLRSPLTVISGRAQLLVQRLARKGLEQEAQSATMIVESSLRMNQMIEDLVDRSRTDPDTDMQHRSAIDLGALVQRMIDQTIAHDDRAHVTLEARPTPLVIVEVAQIERVVVNLLTNALKFSPGKQPIIVQIYQHSTDLIIAVIDQGIGIASADLQHLFEKHYRAHTVRQIEGSGLGLYSSRLIVEAHGGRIWAESTVGTGSIFMIAPPLPS